MPTPQQGGRADDAADIAVGFRDVDRPSGTVSEEAPGTADRLGRYLDDAAALPFFAEVKRRTLDALRVEPGQVVLDVGCGHGDDVRETAAQVGDGIGGRGLAVGIDPSASFLTEARRRTPSGVSAAYVRAEGQGIPVRSAAVDGVRCERTLQHVAAPEAVVGEMARVLRPAGRMAGWEPDWDTLVVDAAPLDFTRLVCRRRAEAIRNPSIGRRLATLIADVGLDVVSIEPMTQLVRDLEMAERAFELSAEAQRLVDASAASAAAARNWVAEIREKDRRGTFLAAVTGFLVVARRPDSVARRRDDQSVE